MAIDSKLQERLLTALRTPEQRTEMVDLLNEVPLSAVVTISPAQMLAAFTTAIQLVPAPGAGKVIVVDAVYSTIDYNSAAYAVGSSETLNIRYAGGATIAGLTETYLESSADARQLVRPAVAASTPVVNTAVVAQMSATNPTTGNSEVKIKVLYRIVDALM